MALTVVRLSLVEALLKHGLEAVAVTREPGNSEEFAVKTPCLSAWGGLD
jgi:hypothetical protein